MKNTLTSLLSRAAFIAAFCITAFVANAADPIPWTTSKPVPQYKPVEFTSYVGKWKVTYPNNGVRFYTITPGQNLTSTDGKTVMRGHMTQAADSFYEVELQNKNFYRIRVEDDKLVIDHYLTRQQYKSGLPITQLGIGERSVE